MAVKIRKAKRSEICNACLKNEGTFYDLGFGHKSSRIVITLCDGCMHMLLQKLIIMGSKYNEVQ